MIITLLAAVLFQDLFTTPFSLEQMHEKQAVIETTKGNIIIQLLPQKAPNHVGHFIKLTEEGEYNGTSFHRTIKHGIVQGGDPKTKDPEAFETYGTGGLGTLALELSDEQHTRGAISAVQIPGNPNSAGSQFFFVVTDQPQLDGQYTVFARVIEGVNLIQTISEIPTDATGRPLERVEIVNVTLRDKPPPEIPPFSTETIEELSVHQVTLVTSFGEITVELFPDRAEQHVRNFLRLAKIGAYEGVTFHRIVPGFVIQTGFLQTRKEPPSESILKYVKQLDPEFNQTPHVAGILSMARGDDVASADTSFFIVTGNANSLDEKYTVFGRVVEGMQIVSKIEALPLNGEEPSQRVEITHLRIERTEP